MSGPAGDEPGAGECKSRNGEPGAEPMRPPLPVGFDLAAKGKPLQQAPPGLRGARGTGRAGFQLRALTENRCRADEALKRGRETEGGIEHANAQ